MTGNAQPYLSCALTDRLLPGDNAISTTRLLVNNSKSIKHHRCRLRFNSVAN